MARKQQQDAGVPELEERVVSISRVYKVVKGGRRMSLSVLVVVGDGKGRVGIGMGKSKEVPTAIAKGVEDAKKNMFKVSLVESRLVPGSFTVPHEIMGEFGAGRVLIKPALPGTGVMAGGPVRAIMELAGVTDVITKSLGTSNAMNIVKAAGEGLRAMETADEVASRRDVTVDHLYGRKEAK
jgi:small subunit ribosomal protein S5